MQIISDYKEALIQFRIQADNITFHLHRILLLLYMCVSAYDVLIRKNILEHHGHVIGKATCKGQVYK